MKLLDFYPETKVSKLDLGLGTDGLLEVEYYPTLLTNDYDDDDVADDGDKLIDRLCSVLVSWDMQGPLPSRESAGKEVGSIVKDGAKIPIEPEALNHLPIPFLGTVFAAIYRDAMPDPKEMQRRSRRRG